MKEGESGSPYHRKLELYFHGNRLTVSFNVVNIPDYIDNLKKRHRDFQVEKYQMLISEYNSEYVEKDRLMIVGNANLNFVREGFYFGFNIVLSRSSEEDLYGQWNVCKFQHMMQFANVPVSYHFSLVPPEFFKRYDYCRSGAMNGMTMTYRTLLDQDIVDLISQMPNY